MFIEACFSPHKPQAQQCPICPSLEFACRSVITVNFPAFNGRRFFTLCTGQSLGCLAGHVIQLILP